MTSSEKNVLIIQKRERKGKLIHELGVISMKKGGRQSRPFREGPTTSKSSGKGVRGLREKKKKNSPESSERGRKRDEI